MGHEIPAVSEQLDVVTEETVMIFSKVVENRLAKKPFSEGSRSAVYVKANGLGEIIEIDVAPTIIDDTPERSHNTVILKQIAKLTKRVTMIRDKEFGPMLQNDYSHIQPTKEEWELAKSMIKRVIVENAIGGGR